jgi:DNA-binding transcriptional LysR family regulator
VAYASPRYLKRRGVPETLADLAAHDCVLFRSLTGKARWELTNDDGKTAGVDVTGPLSTDDMSFVRSAVMAGCGIGMLPGFLCARAEQRGRVVRVLPQWSLHGAVLHLAYPSSRFVPQRVVVLREFLVRELGEIGKKCEVLEAAQKAGRRAS